MSPGLFILSITLYLVAMVTSLVASFFQKHIPAKVIWFVAGTHLLLFILWLIYRNGTDSLDSPGTSNYLFLSWFCTGLVVSGVVLRKQFHVLVKGYFMLFLLTLPVFLVSPSRVLGFIASGNVKAVDPERFRLVDNYFLMAQQSTATQPPKGMKPFRLVREMGMFHKTIARDIMVPENIDSVRMLKFQENENIFARIYGSGADSLDIVINLNASKNQTETITRKQNP